MIWPFTRAPRPELEALKEQEAAMQEESSRLLRALDKLSVTLGKSLDDALIGLKTTLGNVEKDGQ